MRWFVSLLIVIALIAGYYLYGAEDEHTASSRVSKSEQVKAEAKAETPERRLAKDRVTSPKKSGTREAKAAVISRDAEAAPEEKAAEEKGPFTVSLGSHRVHFRHDKGFAVRLKVLLKVPDSKTKVEVMRQRRRLVRMLFFLIANRRVDGTRGDDGRDRLIKDLAIRYGNVIKSGPIDGIEFKDFEVVSVQRPDGGTP